ncbi:hypothetical protein DPMN_144853 [Dreissena polymorpha]|uniref:Uncharacterized protein n=1 Tax=Dreissena polymorpha TaxID=45954 RepID=A0A9D4F4W2_DREPO|nr:hypothetical protein DPMN_144853 [Dreissena polymorpha]
MYPKCETQYCRVVYDQGPSVKLSDSVAEFYRAAALQPDDLWRGVTTHRTSTTRSTTMTALLPGGVRISGGAARRTHSMSYY